MNIRNGFARLGAKLSRSGQKKNGDSGKWNSLYHTLAYQFHDESLIQQAMTHRSYLQKREPWESNERLEFLGDAVLGMMVTDELYRLFPHASEGELTRIKASVVSRQRLSEYAESIELGGFILLGGGEEKSGGRIRASILSDAFEALVGAVYLDGGEECIRGLVRSSLLKNIKPLISNKYHSNYKSWLLEHVQGKGESSPRYHVLRELGPDHKKQFVVEVTVGHQKLAEGSGLSKKKAEQEAAFHALKTLGLINKQ
jgi:ribonuclease-3